MPFCSYVRVIAHVVAIGDVDGDGDRDALGSPRRNVDRVDHR
jgi:hypothetical protein